jgi:rod shape-determining protein MreD
MVKISKQFFLFCLILFSFLLQISFFPAFLGAQFFHLEYILNFPLILIILISLFTKKSNSFLFFVAFFVGFLFDLYSEKIFGVFILFFLILVLFIERVLKKYVQFY